MERLQTFLFFVRFLTFTNLLESFFTCIIYNIFFTLVTQINYSVIAIMMFYLYLLTKLLPLLLARQHNMS